MNFFRYIKKGHSLLRGFINLAIDELVTIKNYEERRTTAAHPRHDDLYVVSFPKSGATWMNFLMANLHTKMSNIEREVTFFNVHDFIPDIQTTKEIKSEPLPFPGYRVIKSHSNYNGNYLKVLCIVRDPRDTLLSYFHFLCGLGQFHGTLSELIRDKQFGITAWVRHVSGWLDTPASLSIDFVRYEDLLQEPRAELTRIYGLLGHKLDAEHLDQAIANSSFQKMRASEVEWNYGRRPAILENNLKFMRFGKAGGWRESYTTGDLQYIESLARRYMRHFSYEELAPE